MTDFRSSASLQALKSRAQLCAEIRAFFAREKVLEVETPILSAAGNSDPAITQFATRGSSRRWLRSSPEYALKRLLASGVGDCYELGRVFRAGESGRLHNQEFTLLEWYRLGWDYHELMRETVKLVQHCGQYWGQQWAYQKLSWSKWFEQYTGLASDSKTQDLAQKAERAGIQIHGSQPTHRDQWLDLLVSHLVQPQLPERTITVVYDYPASQAALARISPARPEYAERFEVFVGPHEIANGYRELTDAVEQRQRFEQENLRRLDSGDAVVPLDERLLAALEAGLPECSGVAMGVDRLLMVCRGYSSLDEVLAFPNALA